MPRRILTAREYHEMSAPWLEAGRDSDLQEYRTERHRQEVELEGLTGGHPADISDYFARGGKPLINYNDWMRGKKIGPGEQAARDAPISHEVYTPDPAAWGTDDDDPPWVTAHRTAATSHPDLETQRQLGGCVHSTGGRWHPDLHRVSFNRLAAGFDDPSAWNLHTSFNPAPVAVQGAKAYAQLRGLPDPHSGATDYLNARRTPASVKATGQAYDALPGFDPNAVKHFEAMRQGVHDQHDFMTNRLGIRTESVDHDPYSDVHEMLDDVNNNKRLQVLGTHATGGHPYFDDDTNDKFRAVHDFFGHAATGRSFDRHGEQATYLAHAQMFHPEARSALASETRGQNSSLILNGGFRPQKVGIMPQQFWSGDHELHLSAIDELRLIL
jgi:hypothetical protein